MRNRRSILLFLLAAATAGALRANCRWEVAPPAINFGTYLPVNGSALDGRSTYTVRCTPNSTGQVVISAGTAPASFTPRTLKGPGGQVLPYNLFIEVTHNTIWGDGTSGSSAPAAYTTGSGGGNQFFTATIYGLVPAGTNVSAGSYTDSVNVDIWDGVTRDSVSMPITALVAPDCKVDSFSILFGDYDPTATTPLDKAAPITVRCNLGAFATVSLNSGVNNPSGVGQRKLIGPGGVLYYDIYRESSRSTVWDTSNTKTGTALPPAGTPVDLAPGGSFMFGRIDANQDVPAGTYTDTVQATVDF